MKHPLTSKERRGLLAVAAAALFCISSAFIFRNCSSITRQSYPLNHESVDSTALFSDSISESSIDIDSINIAKKNKGPKKSKRSSKEKEDKTRKKSNSAKKSQKRKTPKSYPIRDPLSEPCD